MTQIAERDLRHFGSNSPKGAASVTATARVQAMGEVIATTLDYPGIRYQKLAVRVAERDLRVPELQPNASVEINAICPLQVRTLWVIHEARPFAAINAIIFIHSNAIRAARSPDYLRIVGFSLSGKSFGADAEPSLL